MTTYALLALSLAFSACDDDSDVVTNDEASITIADKLLSIGAEGGQLTTSVSASREFGAFTDVDWISVAPYGSTANQAQITLNVEANSSDQRTGHLIIRAGSARDSVTVVQAASTQESIECPVSGYSLVWHDEFDGTSLSRDWTAATGMGSNGWGNNELQYYTSDASTVSDGTLKITLSKNDGQITSSRLYAKVSTGWRYGYFQARIKLPSGKGTWPAFWMMPVNFTAWPADGEIDIMEAVGYDPNVVHSTIHCNKYNNTGTAKETARRSLPTSQTEFHDYAVEWTAKKMTFYVDGKALLTYENDGTGKDAWPFDSAFYPILNLAWGGAWGGAQGVDESCLPAVMEVDYIRIFQ